jgi:hypothetical protein
MILFYLLKNDSMWKLFYVNWLKYLKNKKEFIETINFIIYRR